MTAATAPKRAVDLGHTLVHSPGPRRDASAVWACKTCSRVAIVKDDLVWGPAAREECPRQAQDSLADVKVGDPIPDECRVAISGTPSGCGARSKYFCTRDVGHLGHHVATDGTAVIGVWT